MSSRRSKAVLGTAPGCRGRDGEPLVSGSDRDLASGLRSEAASRVLSLFDRCSGPTTLPPSPLVEPSKTLRPSLQRRPSDPVSGARVRSAALASGAVSVVAPALASWSSLRVPGAPPPGPKSRPPAACGLFPAGPRGPQGPPPPRLRTPGSRRRACADRPSSLPLPPCLGSRATPRPRRRRRRRWSVGDRRRRRRRRTVSGQRYHWRRPASEAGAQEIPARVPESRGAWRSRP